MSRKRGAAEVTKLIKGRKVAMLTHVDIAGRLVSHPMATQNVEFDGDVWFIAQRGTHLVENLERGGRVNVAYSGKGAWVSLAGRAAIVDDPVRLRQYWNTFADAWFTGGPDDPDNILIHVVGDTAEYWKSKGGVAGLLMNLVLGALGRPAKGENRIVDF